jgi:hypothetical protein
LEGFKHIAAVTPKLLSACGEAKTGLLQEELAIAKQMVELLPDKIKLVQKGTQQ